MVSKSTVVRYERQDDLIRLTIKNASNHEIREVMVGLWYRLDPADRADHIRELSHYQNDRDAWPSPVASAIAIGDSGESSIDLKAMIERGERVRP